MVTSPEASSSLKLAEQLVLLVEKASKTNDKTAYDELVSSLLDTLDGTPDVYHKSLDILNLVMRNRIEKVLNITDELISIFESYRQKGMALVPTPIDSKAM